MAVILLFLFLPWMLFSGLEVRDGLEIAPYSLTLMAVFTFKLRSGRVDLFLLWEKMDFSGEEAGRMLLTAPNNNNKKK